MKTLDLKLTRIGNSRGIRLPVALIKRYGFSGSLAVKSDEASKTCPGLAVMFELLTVTTGGVSIRDAPVSQPIASMTRRSLALTSSATPLRADAL